MLEMRMQLPDKWVTAEGLTEEGEKHMLMYAELLQKSGMSNFKVVRVK